MAEKSMTLYCSCGCMGGICVNNEHNTEPDLPYINLVCNADRTIWHGLWWRTKSKAKRIWGILRDKEVSYFDIVVTKQEPLNEFKEFVAGISGTSANSKADKYNTEPIYCSVGCKEGVSLKAERDTEFNYVTFELVLRPASLIYSDRKDKALEILKRFWYSISNKEYRYFEIWMSDKNELAEFKEFIAEI